MSEKKEGIYNKFVFEATADGWNLKTNLISIDEYTYKLIRILPTTRCERLCLGKSIEPILRELILNTLWWDMMREKINNDQDDKSCSFQW